MPKPKETLGVELTAPYPEICVLEPNQEYAGMMLDNMGGCNSEMSAVALYFYDYLVTKDAFEELSGLFHQINMVEMHHLEIFGTLALKLGADPRLWTPCKQGHEYWIPGYLKYPREIKELVCHAVASEKQAVKKYLRQAQVIGDRHIVANLTRIIEDEQRHIEALSCWCRANLEPSFSL